MATQRYHARQTATETGTDGAGIRDLLTAAGTGSFTTENVNDTAFQETVRFINNGGTTFATGSLTWAGQINVTSLNGNTIEGRFRFQRRNSSGVVQSSSAYSTAFTTTGVKTLSTSWNPGTWAAGDRLCISVEIRRTGGHGNVTIQLGTAGSSYVDAQLAAAASWEQIQARVFTDGAIKDYDGGADPQSLVSQQIGASPTIKAGNLFHALFAVEHDAGASGTFTGQLQYQHNGGTWTDVTASSTHVKAAICDPSNINHEATTDRIGGAGTFVAGAHDGGDKGEADGLVPGVSLASGQHTEVSFAFYIDPANVSDADTVNLRVRDTGGGTVTYTESIAITVEYDTTALPAVITNHGATQAETQSFVGPIIDTNGNLYIFAEPGGKFADDNVNGYNVPVAFKSPDGGYSWLPVDRRTLDTDPKDIESFSTIRYSPDTTGNWIVMSSGNEEFEYDFFRTSDHATNPDTFADGNTKRAGVGATSPTEYSVVALQRSDGTIIGANIEGGTPQAATLDYQTAAGQPGTWNGRVTIDGTAGDVSCIRGQLGLSDRALFVYKDHTNGVIYSRALSAANSLLTERNASSGVTIETAVGSDTNIIDVLRYDDTNDDHLVVYQADDLTLYSNTLEWNGSDYIPGTPVQVSTTAVRVDAPILNDGTIDSTSVQGAAMAVDSSTGTVYLFYVNSSTENLEYRTWTVGGGWSSATVLYTSSGAADRVQYTSAHKFTHSAGNGGGDVIGVVFDIYDWTSTADPVDANWYYDEIAAAVGATALTGTTFTKAPSFPTGTVTPGPVALTGTTFTRAPTFPTGTVTPAATPLTGVLFAKAPSFFTGTVTPGPVALTGTTFTKAPSFPTGTVTPGPVALTGTTFTRAPTFPQGTVAAGAIALTGSLFTKAPSFFTGTVAVGPVALTGVTFQRAPTFPTGTVTPGPVALTGVLFTRAATFPTGTVAVGGVALTGTTFTKAPTFPTGAIGPFPVLIATQGNGTSFAESEHEIGLPNNLNDTDLVLLVVVADANAGTLEINFPADDWTTLVTAADAGLSVGLFAKFINGETDTSTVEVGGSGGTFTYTSLFFHLSGAGGVEAAINNLASAADPPALSPGAGSRPYWSLSGGGSASSVVGYTPSTGWVQQTNRASGAGEHLWHQLLDALTYWTSLDPDATDATPTDPINFTVGVVPGSAIVGTTFAKAPTFPGGVVNVAGQQNLGGTLFTKAPVFPTGTVTPGPVALTGTTFTKAPSFPTGTVDTTYALTGTLFTKAPTFPTGTVTPGPVALTGTTFQRAPTFPIGTVTSGPVALTGTTFTKAPTFSVGTVTPGAVALTGTTFTKAPSFFTGAVAVGNGLVGQLFAVAPTFPTGTVTPGPVALAGVTFTKAPTFPTGSVQVAGVQAVVGVLFTKAPTFFVGVMSFDQDLVGATTFTTQPTFFVGTVANDPNAFPSAGVTTDGGRYGVTADRGKYGTSTDQGKRGVTGDGGSRGYTD